MQFRFCVIASFYIYDEKSNTFSTKVHSDVFTNLDDAFNHIRSFDYPPVKVTLHLLSH